MTEISYRRGRLAGNEQRACTDFTPKMKIHTLPTYNQQQTNTSLCYLLMLRIDAS